MIVNILFSFLFFLLFFWGGGGVVVKLLPAFSQFTKGKVISASMCISVARSTDPQLQSCILQRQNSAAVSNSGTGRETGF